MFTNVDTTTPVGLDVVDPGTCAHVGSVVSAVPSAAGCEDCLRTGSAWVHLRLCMSCGHVGCCDSSPNHHATAHYEATGHPVIRSVEPGESWGWCYPDETILEPR